MKKSILGILLIALLFACQKQVDYQPQIKLLNSNISALQKSRDSLAAALAQTNNNLNTTNNNVAALSKSLDSIKVQLTSIGAQIATLNSQMALANANIATLTAQIATLNQQYIDLLAKFNLILTQLSTVSSSLSSGLVVFYPFNGNTNDSSGNSYDGIIYGAKLTTDRFGLANRAYIFNGISDFIQTKFEGILGSKKRAVSFWAKSNTLNISQGGMSAVTWGPFTVAGTRFDAYFNFNLGGATANIAGAAVTYSTLFNTDDNLWHHYVYMIDTDNATVKDIKIYQDGILLTKIIDEYSSTILVNTLGGYPMKIGRTTATGIPAYFNGSIDEVRVYDRSLTISEIISLSTH